VGAWQILRVDLVALTGTLYLSGLWPPMSEAVRYLMAWCSYYRLEGSIVSGRRTWSQQTALYAQHRTPSEIAQRVSFHGARGTVTDAVAGDSAHNWGLAIDVDGPDQAEIVQLAHEIGFGTISWDPGHIEWPNWRVLVARAS